MSRACGPVACASTKPLGEANGRRDDALHLARDQRLPAISAQQRMEARVVRDVAENAASPSAGSRSSSSMRCRQSRASAQQHGADAALGGQPRGQAFERAAQFDRVVDVALGKVRTA